MDYSDRQYERVARYLDGEPIELTRAERTLVAEMMGLEAQLCHLDTTVPQPIMETTRWRLRSALNTRPSTGKRRRWWVGFAAAAAVALVAISVWSPTPSSDAPSGGTGIATADETAIYQDVLVATSPDELTTSIELVDGDVSELEEEMFVSLDPTGEVFADADPSIEDADERLDELSTYDPFEGLGG